MRRVIMVIWALWLGGCTPPLTPMRPTTVVPTTAVVGLSSSTLPLSPMAAVATATETPERVQTPVIIWRHTDNNGQCLQARIGRESLEAGPCDETLTLYPLDERRQAELSQFLDTFYTFEADTEAGHVRFNGTNQGLNAMPFPAEERMLAYWVWDASEQARSGRSPDWSLAIEWVRDQDGRCEKLLVTLSGFAEALSCDDGKLAELGRKRLSPEELARLYDWYDRFETTQTERFTLSGSGSIGPEEADQQAIDRYAEGLYAALYAMSPGAAGTPVEPLATGAFVHFDSWSPDSLWIAYWLSSPEDVAEQVPYAMPGGALHFADVETGEVCAVPQFQTEAANAAFVNWLDDGTAVVIVGEESFKGVPCQTEPFALYPEYKPEESGGPDLALSPDGRYRAATTLVSSRNGVLTFETTLTADGETHSLQTATWQIDERIGDYRLGGEWVSRTQFLIYGTLTQGPLLIDINRGVIPVLTDLFGMEKIPSILDQDEYSLQAMATPAIEPDTFHLVVSGVGLEGNFPPAMLYHAESDVVETLPFRKVWGFSADYEWLFLFEGVYVDGYETGYHLWMRRLEDVEGKWRLIAPLVDYVLWREDESEMVFVQNETTVARQTFPQGEPVGRWHTGGYWVQPVAFSPDGRYVVALGNRPGQWEYGLFVLGR